MKENTDSVGRLKKSLLNLSYTFLTTASLILVLAGSFLLKIKLDNTLWYYLVAVFGALICTFDLYRFFVSQIWLKEDRLIIKKVFQKQNLNIMLSQIKNLSLEKTYSKESSPVFAGFLLKIVYNINDVEKVEISDCYEEKDIYPFVIRMKKEIEKTDLRNHIFSSDVFDG
jgi:hypothetical protein